MSEARRLWIEGPVGKLECALRVAMNPRAAAVLAHPHPLYGGTLENPVVFHADRALHRTGVTTLRFNFRGVGKSDGLHDEGRGEVRDVGAALSWLRGLAPGAPLLLVGYSFGAWCALGHALEEPSSAAFIGIGLPVRSYSFTGLPALRRPWAVVQGTEDELGTLGEVRALLALL